MPDLFTTVQGIVFTDDERVPFQMREWNRIKVAVGPGAGWQGEGEGRQGEGEGRHGEGRQGEGEGGANGAGEQNGSDPDNMLTITVQVQP